ncbi:hypothetical protein [Kribbella deserti]|uniref:Secreted protein n=1 Tax=Kribbella deserti TaxID=1926257 RepID=A0ABV6QEP6_9ACTN
MTKRFFRTSAVVAVASAIAMFAAPSTYAAYPANEEGRAVVQLAQVGHDDDSHATEAHPTEAIGKRKAAPAPTRLAGWDTPTARSYYLTSSCRNWASTIRQGAAAWNRLTEGGGTPVECRNGYITDCGGGTRVVGCNWGRGQRIALYMGGVTDGALLAAHEFGHDWYGHSTYRCAGWSSPAHVMAPSICN